MDREACRARLHALAHRLQASGHIALAEELAGLAREVATSSSWPGDLLTPNEAATALGVRSVNTVKRWAREGRLEGYVIGGRLLVSQRSVNAFHQTTAVQRQRSSEHELDEALAPFAGSSEEIEAYTSETPPGRVPWRANAATTV